MNSCYPLLLATLPVVLFWNPAKGAEAKSTEVTPYGLCVAPGDPLVLECKLRAARSNDIRLSFLKDSVAVSAVHVSAHPELCRPRGSSGCAWDLGTRVTIDPVSPSDAGVYSCQASNESVDSGSTRVFVQYHTEMWLPPNVTVANIGDEVRLKSNRSCDKQQPVRVTKNGGDGAVQALPYRYRHDGYRGAYVNKLDGSLVIPAFQCADVGNYTFTVLAARGFQAVSTSASSYIYLSDSCEGCCPDTVLPTPTSKTGSGTSVGQDGSPDQSLDAATPASPTAYIVVIVILVVSGVVVVVVLIRHYRRKIRNLRRPTGYD